MGKYNTERKHKEGQEMYKAVYHFILKYYRKHHYMPCLLETLLTD